MARQFGPVHYSGTIGDITHRRTKDGAVAQKKSSLNKERVSKDPAFEGSRRASGDFKNAAIAVGKIRRAFLPLFKSAADARCCGRMTPVLQRIIAADIDSPPDNRQLLGRHIHALRSYELNKNKPLRGAFPDNWNCSFDAGAAAVTVNLPEFRPSFLDAPPAATHFRLLVGAAIIDFRSEEDAADAAIDELPWIPLDQKAKVGYEEVFLLPEGNEHPVVVIAALQFSLFVNGIECPLQTMAYNCAAVIAAMARDAF